MPAAVILGARNLGGAILDRLLADGWSAAAVAQSDDTLAAVEARGALALRADATSPDELARHSGGPASSSAGSTSSSTR
jgi:Trk K+ transport system NAD-binding subunit